MKEAPVPITRPRSHVDWLALLADGAPIHAGDLHGSLLVAPLDAERNVLVLMVPVGQQRTEYVKAAIRSWLSLAETGRWLRGLSWR